MQPPETANGMDLAAGEAAWAGRFRRGWKRWLVAFLILTGIGGVATYLQHRPDVPGINRANYLKIKPGMTVTEVEAILGGPPIGDDLAKERHYQEGARLGIRFPNHDMPPLVWNDGKVSILIFFDGKTEKAQGYGVWNKPLIQQGVCSEPPTLLDRVFAWIKDRWRRWFR
jgi:hypothetical protein